MRRSMTVKGKFRLKVGRKARLASWLSLSGALAMVLFGGPAVIAEGRSESSGRAASKGQVTPTILAQTEAPPGGASPGVDTQGPNAAPDAQQAPFPEPTPTESPATDEPALPESPAPEGGQEGTPGAAPDAQQQQAPFPEPTPTESPATDEPALPESPAPEGGQEGTPGAAPDAQQQQAPFPEPTPTESPSPAPTESPTSESTEIREENIVLRQFSGGS